jgi:hypothetical protein
MELTVSVGADAVHALATVEWHNGYERTL